MDLKVLVTVFGIVFLAELGDKTQLATLLFASRSPGNLIAVFVGASAALVLASAIGVVAGGLISQYVSPKSLSYIAGVGFVLIGFWTIWQGSNLG
jgi:putative Ca2+/H+ antiporter (TMEM165/GDT1 family)